MLNISELYEIDPSAIGILVNVAGVLLGARDLVVADSIEDYDRGIAVPILQDDLGERMFMCGVYSVGGGRFAYKHNCMIDAMLAPGVRGYKYALAGIVRLTVKYYGKDVQVIPASEQA